MKVLIEYYDKDVLKNIMAPLTLKPDRVVYLYDRGMQDMTVFTSLETCFRAHMETKLETVPIDNSSIEQIRLSTRRVMQRYAGEDCMLELTGGSELMMIGGYQAGKEMGARLLHTD